METTLGGVRVPVPCAFDKVVEFAYAFPYEEEDERWH